MNPISPVPSSGVRAESRDPAAVPTDLAGLFAALFAATTAQPVVPQPPIVVPTDPQVPVGTVHPEALTCAEGEQPQVASGGWPGAVARGTQAFPGFTAHGRPRLEQNGLTAALVELPSARQTPDVTPEDAALALGDAIDAPVTPQTPATDAARPGFTLPAGMKPVTPQVAQVLQQAIAAAVQSNALQNAPVVRGANVQVPKANNLPGRGDLNTRVTDAEESIGEVVSREGLRGAAKRGFSTDGKSGEAASAGQGKGKSRASGDSKDKAATTSDADAVANAGFVPTPEKPTPVAPPHAALAGVTPHVARADAPAPAVGGVAGPAPLPPEKPQAAVPTTATVAFDNGEGLEGRLRVSLRGDTLRATIQVPDVAAAERIEQDLGGLTRALRAHGFEEARLTIDVARSAASDARHDEPSPREQRPSREQQPHTNDRHPRRERGSSREER